MPTKFRRERYRELAHAKLRAMDRASNRSAPRGRVLQTFLVVYLGIGAYMVLGMFLETTMTATPTVDHTRTAIATVTARGDEPVQEEPRVYGLDVHVEPDGGDDAFEHVLHVDEMSWVTAAVGDTFAIRYERVGENDRVLVLDVHVPTPEVEEQESTLALYPQEEEGPLVEAIAIEAPVSEP